MQKINGHNLKGWVLPTNIMYSKDDYQSHIRKEMVYVEEIPENAIRFEARMELTSFIKDNRETSRLLLTLPAHLIGKKVSVLIVEVEE